MSRVLPVGRENMFDETKQEIIVNSLKGVLACCMALGLNACSMDSAQVTSSGGPDIASAQAELYNGPKARIAVLDFQDKMSTSGQYNAAHGRGMSDILTTALFQTNRYIVLERDRLQEVIGEQNLGASGRVDKDTAASVRKILGVELFIIAVITGFDPGVAGREGNLGKFGDSLGILGSMLPEAFSYKKAHVAMDLRVVDTRTAQIVAATSVEASQSGLSTAGSGMLGGSLSTFSKTPMETAIRQMIQKAVTFIVTSTPPTYYHFSATAAPARAAAPAQPSRHADGSEATELSNPSPSRPAAALVADEDALAKKSEAADDSTMQDAGTVAANLTASEDEVGTPRASKVIQAIRTDFDHDLIVDLNESKRRGAIVVSLTLKGEYCENSTS